MQLRLMCIIAMVLPGIVTTWPQDQQFQLTMLGGAFTYSIRAGDTLDSIASRFGVSSADLIESNRLSKPYRLAAGQPLTVDIRTWR